MFRIKGPGLLAPYFYTPHAIELCSAHSVLGKLREVGVIKSAVILLKKRIAKIVQ